MGVKRAARIATLAGIAAACGLWPLVALSQGVFERLPAWAPPPPSPADNPTTPAKAELGRRLFYDGRLARDGLRSCASCHDPSRAFTDLFPFSWGVTGQRTPRQAPTLANLAWASSLTWANPATVRLEDQAAGPMFGQHPVEMGMAGLEEDIAERLKAEPLYRQGFAAAFPGQADPITLANALRAIAAFERTLISLDAPYDRYRQGDKAAISEAARRGEALFNGDRLKCASCHSGLFFTDAVGKAEGTPRGFHNTGLYNVDGKGGYPADNLGLAAGTGDGRDIGRFKTPTLRNIALTAPYMHDGSVATLEAALDHYAAGGRVVPEGQKNAGDGRKSPLKDPVITGFSLSAEEKADVIAFLNSLTDEGFTTDPKLQNPWKAP